MYILIIILSFSSSVATSTAEFGNLAACQKAAEVVRAETRYISAVRAICVEKTR